MEISDLILWCARVQSDALEENSLDNFDWARFLQQLHYHRIFPVVIPALNKSNSAFFPEFVTESLLKSSNLDKRKILRLNFECSRVMKALSEQGVRAIFYKGITLSHLAYSSPFLRTFDDLDILVCEADYLKPQKILSQYGYISPDFPTLSREGADNFRHYAGEYSLVNPKGTICLDIHSRLLGGGSIGFSKQFGHVWERAVEIDCSTGKTLTLCVEDLLLYLCLNGLKDGWESLRTVCDIDRLIRNSHEMNWTLVLSEAKRLKLERSFRLALLISIELLQTPIPSLVSECLDEDSLAVSLKNRVCRQIRGQIDEGQKFSPVRNFILICQALDDWQDQLRYLRGIPIRFYRLLTTVNYRDSEVVKLPRLLHFLYYPIRIFRVLIQYQLDVIKIIFK